MGANWAATTKPSIRASPVISRTSHDCAMRCIQVPAFEASAPVAYLR